MPDITRRDVIRVLGVGAAAVAFHSSASAESHAIIRTLLRDIAPESLAGGATLFHEHMSFSSDFWSRLVPLMFPAAAGRGRGGPQATGPQPTTPGEKYFLEDLDLMVEEISAAKKDGVACLVDGGHPDMGRSLEFLKKLSQRSGMPIVAGCGYYAQPFYTPELIWMSEDDVAHELIRQARTDPVGVFGEIGTWDAMTPDERKVFRAVGKAHLATNLPIFTHTAFGKGALEQLDTLESVGVKPQRIAIGHLGGLIDPKVEVHKAICKRGAYIGFDRQGGGPGDAMQVPMVTALIDAGYADNLLFASDFSIAGRLKRNGGPGYAQTLTVFLPKLRDAGVKEDTLHRIVVDNPRRFLAFVPKMKRKNG